MGRTSTSGMTVPVLPTFRRACCLARYYHVLREFVWIKAHWAHYVRFLRIPLQETRPKGLFSSVHPAKSKWEHFTAHSRQKPDCLIKYDCGRSRRMRAVSVLTGPKGAGSSSR